MTSRCPAGVRTLTAVITLAVTLSACSSSAADEPKQKETKEKDKEDVPVAWEFVTRPDLTPPEIELTTSDAGAEAGVESGDDYVFLGVKGQEEGAAMNGPLIVDAAGNPVWIDPQGDTRWTYDVRVQRYRGKPVLTYWRGDTDEYGYGEGEFVVLDRSYREIATVTTRGTHADFHDGTLTPRGTALLISYPLVPRDLSALGGPTKGFLRDSVVHEVDVATGRELFRWSALEHIPLTDSAAEIDADEEESGTRDAPYDPYHVNSVTEDGRGALLVSARNTHAVYRLHRDTGRIDWILGGESSDFEMPDDAVFAWQHDAERQDDGTITLFDNQAAPEIGDTSRGLRLRLDTRAKTCEVVTTYDAPEKRLSESQGNLEVRDDGTVVVGWGAQPYYSQYAADGTLLQDAKLSGGISYRAYRGDWVGRPTEPPKLLMVDESAYVSWNGATEVARWRFVAGYDEKHARTVATVPAEGFETSASMPDAAYIAAQAIAADGTVLATAEPGSWPAGR